MTMFQRLHHRALPVAGLLGLLLLPGCVGNEAQVADLLSGRFDKIVKEFEAQGGYGGLADDGEGYARHTTVCDAYFQLRDIANYDDCTERLLTKPIPWWAKSLNADIDPKARRRGMYLTNSAIVALELGDYDRALALAEEAVPLIENNTEVHLGLFIGAYQTAGIAHALLGNDAEARRFVELMSSVHSDQWALEKGLIQSRRYGRAGILMALNDYPAVIAAVEAPDDPDPMALTGRAFSAVTSLGLSEVVGAAVANATVDWQNMGAFPLNYMYAKALYETGEVARAKQSYDAALASPLAENFGAIYYSILADRGRIALQEGDVDAAIDYFKRAIEEIERRRKTLSTETAKIGFVGDKQAIYADLVLLLVRQGKVEAAFEYAERGKARALVDLLAQRRDIPLVRPEQSEAANLLRQLDLEETASATPELTDVYPGGRRSLTAVKTELRRAAPELASLVTVTSQSAADIRSRLAPDEQLLEYFYGGAGDRIVAFLVSSDRVAAFELDGRELAADVEALRDTIAAPDDTNWQGWSARLYDRLLAPIASQLTARHLIIVPHGGLHYLPFATLGRDGGMLIDRHAIRLLPSASVLAFLDKGRSPRDGLMVLGNPDLGDARFALPGAEAEAAAIAGKWPAARLLLGRQATESAFKAQSDRYRVLHLASHGQFDASSPLASRMLLAPDAENDGDLLVPEIYGLRLNAELVTLSACETGLGDVAGGDDVIGLTRGFLYAGARSIVASLWQVPDAPTKALMTAFYDNLRAGQDKDTALREAQRMLRKTYPHPFNWAAFQLTGGS